MEEYGCGWFPDDLFDFENAFDFDPEFAPKLHVQTSALDGKLSVGRAFGSKEVYDYLRDSVDPLVSSLEQYLAGPKVSEHIVNFHLWYLAMHNVKQFTFDEWRMLYSSWAEFPGKTTEMAHQQNEGKMVGKKLLKDFGSSPPQLSLPCVQQEIGEAPLLQNPTRFPNKCSLYSHLFPLHPAAYGNEEEANPPAQDDNLPSQITNLPYFQGSKRMFSRWKKNQSTQHFQTKFDEMRFRIFDAYINCVPNPGGGKRGRLIGNQVTRKDNPGRGYVGFVTFNPEGACIVNPQAPQPQLQYMNIENDETFGMTVSDATHHKLYSRIATEAHLMWVPLSTHPKTKRFRMDDTQA